MPTHDTLTNMARLISAIAPSLTPDEENNILTRSGLTKDNLRATITKAHLIKNTPGSTLEREEHDPDMFELTRDRRAWVGVENPHAPGQGFDVRLNAHGSEGLIIDVYIRDNDGKHDVPLDPLHTTALAYNDYNHYYEEQENS